MTWRRWRRRCWYPRTAPDGEPSTRWGAASAKRSCRTPSAPASPFDGRPHSRRGRAPVPQPPHSSCSRGPPTTARTDSLTVGHRKSQAENSSQSAIYLAHQSLGHRTNSLIEIVFVERDDGRDIDDRVAGQAGRDRREKDVAGHRGQTG